MADRLEQRQNQPIPQADGAQQKREEPAGQPPQPPEVEKKLEFTRSQLFGMALILLIPLLTLFGIFGETTSEAVQEGRI